MHSSVCESPRSLGFFGILTCPSLCTQQEVSAPHLLGFFRTPDLTLPLHLSVRESPQLLISFGVLTYTYPLYSTVCEYPPASLFWFPDFFLLLLLSVGECPSIAQFLLVS